MMGSTSIATVLILSLGAMLDAQDLGEALKPFPYPCFDVAPERRPTATCIGPSCQPRCLGNCKPRCGSNEVISSGYCGKGCQCCMPAVLPCQNGASCGSGGKCHRGITCPKGEKLIAGRCGTSKHCRCCAPTTGTCPAPFKQIGSEYLYFHDSSKKNWDDALSHCKSIGGSLAEPANMDDFIDLIESSYSHMKYDIWLGATDRIDEQNWKWLSGGSVPSSLWPAWPGNQPSGDGDCMQIHYHGYSGFFLNDYYCHVKGYFVCECTPQITTGCNGKCSTSKGSGYCKDTCNRGEERLGSCSGGNCSCCRKTVTPSCSGRCKHRTFGEGTCRLHGSCSHQFADGTQLIPYGSSCSAGCDCCPYIK